MASTPNGPTVGFVFKTISDQFGKYNFIKIMSGQADRRYVPARFRAPATPISSAVCTPCAARRPPRSRKPAAAISSPSARWIGRPATPSATRRNEVELPAIELAEPCYSMAISPKTKGQDDKVASGLARLNEEDISFHGRQQRRDPPDGHLRRRRYSGRRLSAPSSRAASALRPSSSPPACLTVRRSRARSRPTAAIRSSPAAAASSAMFGSASSRRTSRTI